jgi:hypothetical protein
MAVKAVGGIDSRDAQIDGICHQIITVLLGEIWAFRLCENIVKSSDPQLAFASGQVDDRTVGSTRYVLEIDPPQANHHARPPPQKPLKRQAYSSICQVMELLTQSHVSCS